MTATAMKRLTGWILAGMLPLIAAPWVLGAYQEPAGNNTPPPAAVTNESDHRLMLERLGITSLRRGPDGDPKSPNAANTDESKATPYPNLPDPLTLKNGKKATSGKIWWDQRRPEIVEDFDREVYGRVPKNTPKVTWEVVGTTQE